MRVRDALFLAPAESQTLCSKSFDLDGSRIAKDRCTQAMVSRQYIALGSAAGSVSIFRADACLAMAEPWAVALAKLAAVLALWEI